MSTAVRAEWWRAEIVPAGAARPREEDRRARPAAVGSVVPFWALMTFTFVLLLAPQAIVPALAPLRPGLLTAALAIAAWLIDRFSCRQPIMRFTPEMAAAAGLMSWALLTVPWSYWPGGSLAFLLDVYLKTLAIFWLLGNVLNTRSRLGLAAWGLALMAVPLAPRGRRLW